MAGLRVRRTWWIVQRIAPEAPLFRELSKRWRPVDRRERRLTPFALLLSLKWSRSILPFAATRLACRRFK